MNSERGRVALEAPSLIPHDMHYGPQAALIAESFTTKLRYSGAGIGYQLASVFAGGPAPLLAAYLFHQFNSSLPIAVYIILGAVVTVIATVLLPEPQRASVAREFEEDAQPAEPARLRRRQPAGRATPAPRYTPKPQRGRTTPAAG